MWTTVDTCIESRLAVMVQVTLGEESASGRGAPGSRSVYATPSPTLKGRYMSTSVLPRPMTCLQRSHNSPKQLIVSPIHNQAYPHPLHVCSTLAPPPPSHLLTIQRPSCRPTLTAVKPPHLYHQRYDSFALSAGLPHTRNPASFVTATFSVGANAARLFTRLACRAANVTPPVVWREKKKRITSLPTLFRFLSSSF